jgi:hypothetical protein
VLVGDGVVFNEVGDDVVLSKVGDGVVGAWVLAFFVGLTVVGFTVVGLTVVELPLQALVHVLCALHHGAPVPQNPSELRHIVVIAHGAPLQEDDPVVVVAVVGCPVLVGDGVALGGVGVDVTAGVVGDAVLSLAST